MFSGQCLACSHFSILMKHWSHITCETATLIGSVGSNKHLGSVTLKATKYWRVSWDERCEAKHHSASNPLKLGFGNVNWIQWNPLCNSPPRHNLQIQQRLLLIYHLRCLKVFQTLELDDNRIQKYFAYGDTPTFHLELSCDLAATATWSLRDSWAINTSLKHGKLILIWWCVLVKDLSCSGSYFLEVTLDLYPSSGTNVPATRSLPLLCFLTRTITVLKSLWKRRLNKLCPEWTCYLYSILVFYCKRTCEEGGGHLVLGEGSLQAPRGICHPTLTKGCLSVYSQGFNYTINRRWKFQYSWNAEF